LRHDLSEQFRHSNRKWEVGVRSKALEEKLNAFEEIGYRIITLGNILHRLAQCQEKRATDRKRLTPRRRPMAVNITSAGENGWEETAAEANSKGVTKGLPG